MKKKIIALILSIGLSLSCLPITTIAADAAVVVAENDTTTQGSYAYVYLRADNFVNVGALDIEIYYDSSAMSIYYTSNGTLFNSASVSTNTNTSGLIKISAMAVNGLTSGTSTYSNRLMTICFKINSDCPVGDYPVVVTVGDAYDNDFNPATISGVNGIIKVEKGSPKNFPFYTSLSTVSVEIGDEFTVQAYHSSSSSYKFASADFNIEYDRDLLKIKSIELDPAFLIEGAVHSINTSNPGFAKISYASTNAISCYNLFKVTFEVIANTEAQTDITITASDVYDDELTAYSPSTATATVALKEKTVVPDYPDFKLEAEKFIVGKPSDISVILEGNSKVAAADFVIDYDKDVFSINSVTANSEALSSGALIVINNNFNDGQIRFSYIMQNGDFSEDTNLITISATPLISPDEHYTMTSSGIDVCDINFNDVTLDYIVDSDCIFLPTVIDPTCTEDGYTSYDCSCGEAYTAEPTPSLGGHNYQITDIESTHPHIVTCTCSRCGDEKTEESVDSSCIECMHIVGSENTRIDYDNHLIFTNVQTCSDITEIIGVSETATTITTASHIFGNYEFLGTGTIISVYDNDVHIGDYTLIVSGDVNGDSVCDVLDCAQVALVKNGHKTLDDVYALAADVNMDEVIDINDYQEIVNITLAS